MILPDLKALEWATGLVHNVLSPTPQIRWPLLCSRVGAEVEPTIADGMACRTPDAQALEMIRKGVCRIVSLDEPEIRMAMRHLFTDTHNVAEGAGASGLAALLKEQDQMHGRKVAVVQTGGNVDRDVFANVLTAS